MKLRGFRIELGEVEAVLMEAPGVKLAAAIVMKDPSATDRLVGFVSPDRVDSEAILAELKQRLPAHFVPSLIVPLAEMPLSPAGKVWLFHRNVCLVSSNPFRGHHTAYERRALTAKVLLMVDPDAFAVCRSIGRS